MDYLNYGNQVQQKPQGFGSVQKQQPNKPQPQGFGLDKKDVNLTKDDFKFGDLTNNYSRSSRSNSDSSKSRSEDYTNIFNHYKDKETEKPVLLQLFPVPVLICTYKNDYTKELNWIRNHETDKDNVPTNYGGKESRSNRQSNETFILDKPELSNIRAFIEDKINFYTSNILASDSKLVITQSWLNKNGKGEYHAEHMHPNSMFSGVWYPKIDETMPPIKFVNSIKRDISITPLNYNQFNSTSFEIPMKSGELIIFPSNLLHSVAPNTSNNERISLSFNTWPKGSMGDIRSLTYLPLDRCV